MSATDSDLSYDDEDESKEDESVEDDRSDILEPCDVDAMVTKEFKFHKDNVLSSLSRLKIDGAFCDVTINAGDMTIRAHRIVLASTSKYFQAMFSNETKESKTGEINFVETQPEILKKCIDFIYSGVVEISMEDVGLILDASEMMELHGLSQLCVEFLAERVNLATCADVINLSHVYQKEALDIPIEKFLLKNLPEFIESEKFLSLSNECLVYCLQLTQDGDRELETIKWYAILSWVKFDSEEREKYFPKLFQAIDLKCFSDEFVLNNVYLEPLVMESKECLQYMLKAQGSQIQNLGIHRKKMNRIIACNRDSRLIHEYDVKSERWYKLARFPVEFPPNVDLLSYREILFVGIGKKFHIFRDGKWVVKCITPTPNETRPVQNEGRLSNQTSGGLFGSQPIGGPFGGNSSGGGFVQTGAGFSFSTNQPDVSCYNICFGLGQIVYMITKDILGEYCITSSKWTCSSISLILGNGFFIAVSHDKIFAMGGFGSERNVLEYSFATKKFEPLSSMLSPKKSGHAFYFCGMVYAFGGDNWPANVEVYDPNLDRWCILEGLKIECMPAKIHLSDKLYLVGGKTKEKFETIELEDLKMNKRSKEANVDMNLCCPSFD